MIGKLKDFVRDVVLFVHAASGLRLREYQKTVARAIVDSVRHKRGLTFVVIMARQAGKNELQAQLEAYLLLRYSTRDMEIVKASPTAMPQSFTSMRRLKRVLGRNMFARAVSWKSELGYIFRVGSARIYFLSAMESSNVVSHTASLLLECDEAQDVAISKWDKDFDPMAASTDATKVFWGTVWTSRTLLAREMRAALRAEREDGIRRVFLVDANAVAAELPEYARYVAKQVAKLGRQHPLVKTQLFLEEVDAEGGMFPEWRRRLMQGEHPRLEGPREGKIYAGLLDVAGEERDEEAVGSRQFPQRTQAAEGRNERGVMENSRRDSTALTIVEVDTETIGDAGMQAPTYRVVRRYLWTGTPHTVIYAQLRMIVEHWGVHYLVADATGVGAGLVSFLDKAFPGRVIPFLFTAKSKSDLGYGFLAVTDTGRFRDYSNEDDELAVEFQRELAAVQYEILEGPSRTMRWSVPDGTRDPTTGDFLHDDLVMSAALCSVLDSQSFPTGRGALVVQGRDPLAEIDVGGY